MKMDLRKILRISSLGRARVAAGKEGLGREVRGQTVLEITDLEQVGMNVLSIRSGDLVLSAFYGVRDDPQKQRRTICELNRAGAAGLVLFYVGQVVPGIDEGVRELCDELAFPLLVFDAREQSVDYATVMGEISELLLGRNTIVDQALRSLRGRLLKAHQENLPLVQALGLIAADQGVSVAILTPELETLAGSGDSLSALQACLPGESRGLHGGAIKAVAKAGGFVYLRRTEVEDQAFALAFQAARGEEAAKAYQDAVLQLLDLTAALWLQDLTGRSEEQWLAAVLRGDRVRAAEIVAGGLLNPAQIRGFFVAETGAEEGLSALLGELQEAAQAAGVRLLRGRHRSFLILVFIAEEPRDIRGLLEEVRKPEERAWLVPVVGDPELFYWALPQTLASYGAAKQVFPAGVLLGLGELCMLTADAAPGYDIYGELKRALTEHDERHGSNLWETLVVYLLAQRMNTKATASALFVHHNTIQYRLKKIGEVCCLDLGAPADIALLYRTALLGTA